MWHESEYCNKLSRIYFVLKNLKCQQNQQMKIKMALLFLPRSITDLSEDTTDISFFVLHIFFPG